MTGTLTWGANDTNPKTISIPILNDNLAEFNEDLQIQLLAHHPAQRKRSGYEVG